MGTTRVGFECKLYRLSTGTRAAWPATGAPTGLNEVTIARDVTLAIEKGEADVSRRGSAWKLTRGALKDASVEFNLVLRKGDTEYEAIRDAFINGTPLALAVLDDGSATAGAEGLWADWEVLKFSRNETLEEGVTFDVTIKPTDSDVPPEWVTVA